MDAAQGVPLSIVMGRGALCVTWSLCTGRTADAVLPDHGDARGVQGAADEARRGSRGHGRGRVSEDDERDVPRGEGRGVEGHGAVHDVWHAGRGDQGGSEEQRRGREGPQATREAAPPDGGGGGEGEVPPPRAEGKERQVPVDHHRRWVRSNRSLFFVAASYQQLRAHTACVVQAWTRPRRRSRGCAAR